MYAKYTELNFPWWMNIIFLEIIQSDVIIKNLILS